MKEEKTKKKFNKKLLTFGLLGIFAIALVTAGVYLYVGTSKVDVTVDEALSITSVPVSVSGYPGETKTESITIDNLASVSLNVELSYVEFSNEFVLDNTGGICPSEPDHPCEKRIDFDGIALIDLKTIEWEAEVISGYLPHVDVILDNGKALVFEYAKVDAINCDNAPYPTGEVNTFDDKGIVDVDSYAWLSSGPPGPCGDQTFDANHKTLTEWKAEYPSAIILRVEIEVDNWIPGDDANSNVWDVEINGVKVDNGVKYTKPVDIRTTIPAASDLVIDMDFVIATDSPVGKFTGVINVERVA